MIERFVVLRNGRAFVNPSLGCPSSCSYCYLPTEGYEIGKRPTVIAREEEIIRLTQEAPDFIAGRHGTIISLGCFSECWDAPNRKTTRRLIKYFIQLGNPVQFATKRYVNTRDLLGLVKLIEWTGQLSVFISSSTISRWSEFEKGTTIPGKRLSALKEIIQIGIPAFLYIKPVIPDVTILDINTYGDYVQESNCKAVIGETFVVDNSLVEKVPIPSNNLFIANGNPDERAISLRLADYCQVYRTSIEAIEQLRG